MIYNFQNIRYILSNKTLKPDNEETKFFHNALPDNYQFSFDINEWDEDTKTLPLLPIDPSPSFETYSYTRYKIHDTLSAKTNIPQGLIDDAYSGNYKRGDELSFLLRFYLEDIRLNEKTGRGPNVTNTITRSEISLIVGEMIEGIIGEKEPQLLWLLRSLLNLDKSQNNIEQAATNDKKKIVAFELKVEQPELNIQTIANYIHVDRSTVSKWFSSIEAEELIRETKHNPSRIYRYWVSNCHLPLDEIASNLKIEPDYLIKLRNDKQHDHNWLLHSSIQKDGALDEEKNKHEQITYSREYHSSELTPQYVGKVET